jgi:cyclopropane-fatty-acyl-phospholipid synthase
VSNSRSQRTFIAARAADLGLSNLECVTADVNEFRPEGQFDRIVSVEMFEHVSNWPALLDRARIWLAPDGRLFLHVFTHRQTPYRFDHGDRADFIAQHFFTGGIMPSRELIREFSAIFELDREWTWNGRHYARTAEDWLANFDRNSAAIMGLFKEVYRAEAGVWHRRWRLFFLATAGLFGHHQGNEWQVSHFLLKPGRDTSAQAPPNHRATVGAA